MKTEFSDCNLKQQEDFQYHPIDNELIKKTTFLNINYNNIN